MKKFKKLIFIIPMIFTICLSVIVPLSSLAVFESGNTPVSGDLDDSYWCSLDEFNYHDSSRKYFYIEVLEDYCGQLKAYSYYADLTWTSYNIAENAEAGIINVTASGRFDIYWWYETPGYGKMIPSQTRFRSAQAFTFNKKTHEFIAYDSSGNEVLRTEKLSYHKAETNLFDVVDTLKVDVTFKPSLSGEVDRSVVDQNGNEGLGQVFSMHVANNSNFAIQYVMRIYESSNTSTNPVFVYYSDDWCYYADISSKETFFGSYKLTNKASFYHRVAAKSSESIIFHYNQVNLKQGTQYYVTVEAVKCPYQYASYNVLNKDEDNLNSDKYEISKRALEVVYSSYFSMKQYDDVTYDHSSNAQGVLPYDGTNGNDDANKYAFSRNAVVNDDGSINYQSLDLLNDNSSWYHTNPLTAEDYVNNVGETIGNAFVGIVYTLEPFSYSGSSSFGSSFSGFGGMLSSVFSLFPSEYYAVFMFGLVALVIIGIIKAVK